MNLPQRILFRAWRRRKRAEIAAYVRVRDYALESEDGDIHRLCKAKVERLSHELTVAQQRYDQNLNPWGT